MRTTTKSAALLAAFLAGCALFQRAPSLPVRTGSARETLETGRAFLKVDRFRDAITYYDMVLNRWPDQTREASWALYERAYCLYRLRRYDEALEGFRKVLSSYPDEAGPVALAQRMIPKTETAMRKRRR